MEGLLYDARRYVLEAPNTVSFLNLDQCEREKERSFNLNLKDHTQNGPNLFCTFYFGLFNCSLDFKYIKVLRDNPYNNINICN